MSITDQSLSSVIDANGNASVKFTPLARQGWEIQQANTQAPTIGATALCSVYRSGLFIANLFPHNGVGAGLPFIPVRFGQNFEFRWTGGAVGATVTGIILYDDGQGKQ